MCLCVWQYYSTKHIAVGGHCVCVYIRVVARTNWCRNVVLGGCGRLRGLISYFLTTRFSQMNVEAANEVDAKY